MIKLHIRFSTRNEEVDILTPHDPIQDAQGVLIYPGEEKTEFLYYPWPLITSPLHIIAFKENP